jgi:hypothetical protein
MEHQERVERQELLELREQQGLVELLEQAELLELRVHLVQVEHRE